MAWSVPLVVKRQELLRSSIAAEVTDLRDQTGAVQFQRFLGGRRDVRLPTSAFLTAIALLAASACGQAPPSPPPSYLFASGSAAEKIPVEVVANGLVFVQARINDHPGWFILDNGSQGFNVELQRGK
jgi:hypothetical protein